MRSFRDEICADCKGEKYPRQCRNSEGWRQDKAFKFDDLEVFDFPCPYGVPLNFLPVAAPVRADGRIDYTGCKGCKEKMLAKMQEQT